MNLFFSLICFPKKLKSYKLTSCLKAYSLPDVMVGIVLTSFCLIVVVTFFRDTFQFTAYLRRHQQLRQETLSLVSIVLPKVIREASALDYAKTTDHELSVFVDKEEKKTAFFFVRANLSEDIAQLVLLRDGKEEVLNSPETVIDRFFLEATPRGDRTWQPRVRFRIEAHARHSEGELGRSVFEFFEDPRISYESLATLRNFTFSSFKNL